MLKIFNFAYSNQEFNSSCLYGGFHHSDLRFATTIGIQVALVYKITNYCRGHLESLLFVPNHPAFLVPLSSHVKVILLKGIDIGIATSTVACLNGLSFYPLVPIVLGSTLICEFAKKIVAQTLKANVLCSLVREIKLQKEKYPLESELICLGTSEKVCLFFTAGLKSTQAPLSLFMGKKEGDVVVGEFEHQLASWKISRQADSHLKKIFFDLGNKYLEQKNYNRAFQSWENVKHDPTYLQLMIKRLLNELTNDSSTFVYIQDFVNRIQENYPLLKIKSRFLKIQILSRYEENNLHEMQSKKIKVSTGLNRARLKKVISIGLELSLTQQFSDFSYKNNMYYVVVDQKKKVRILQEKGSQCIGRGNFGVVSQYLNLTTGNFDVFKTGELGDVQNENKILSYLHQNKPSEIDGIQDEYHALVFLSIYGPGNLGKIYTEGDVRKSLETGILSQMSLEEKRKLMIREAFRLIKALDYLGEKKVHHGDIKPSNIFVMVDSKTKKIVFKLGDFGGSEIGGRARIFSNFYTHHGDHNFIKVTSCLNPEKLSLLLSHADMFSLGVTFYEMMTKEFFSYQSSSGEARENDFTKSENFFDSEKKQKLENQGYGPEVISLLKQQLETRPYSRIPSKELREKWGKMMKKDPYC